MVSTCSPALSGIACITLSFMDAHGHPLQVPAQDCAALQKSEDSVTPLQQDHFDELTTVVKVKSMAVGPGTDKPVFTVNG